MDFEVTVEEARRQVAAGKVLLLDVREPWEWATSRIPGSTHVPMGEIPVRLQELDPDQPTVVVCHHGVRSLNVTAWLRQQGFEQVHSLRGGIDRWSCEVDAGVPRY